MAEGRARAGEAGTRAGPSVGGVKAGHGGATGDAGARGRPAGGGNGGIRVIVGHAKGKPRDRALDDGVGGVDGGSA